MAKKRPSFGEQFLDRFFEMLEPIAEDLTADLMDRFTPIVPANQSQPAEAPKRRAGDRAGKKQKPAKAEKPADTLYDRLQISPTADPETIRAAYLSLCKRFHPDVAGPSGEAKTKSITEAYTVLSDATKRRDYDAWLGNQ